MTSPQPPWIGAAYAASLLGVDRATLYAYVSRGYIRSQALPGTPRERIYSRDDVERLRQRTEERRAPDKATAHALQWGLPILESSITLIDGRKLFYRGLDAERLARSRSLEEVAALIWTGSFEILRTGAVATPIKAPTQRMPFIARAQRMLAAAAAVDQLAFDLRTPNVVLT